MNYFRFGGEPLRGNESETVTGVIMPEPGKDDQWDTAFRTWILMVMGQVYSRIVDMYSIVHSWPRF